MPRPPRPDDDYDDEPRRAKPSGGVPALVWVLGGLGLVALLGCGGLGLLFFAGANAVKEAAQKMEAEQKEREAKGKDDKTAGPVVGPVHFGTIQNAYKENQFEADAKYRNKRVLVDIGEIVRMGRDDAGRPVISTHSFGHNPEPTGKLVFASGEEPGLAKLKPGPLNSPIRIEGFCEGRRDDFIDRGIRGFEFTVTFTDCRLREWRPAPKGAAPSDKK